MAEEKPEKKAEGWIPATGAQIFSEVFGLILVMIIVGALLNAITGLFNVGGANGGVNVPWYQRFTDKGMLIAHSKPLSSISDPIGMRVVSVNNNDVYDAPGGKKIGSHKFGDAGRVIQGPVEVNGVKYWYVDYDTDPDGWVKEDDVRSLTTPVSSVENPVGQSVMNTTDSDVIGDYGAVVGRHKAGDKGKITKGPKYINGEKYWYVDYENGADGWVKESDIGIIEENTSFENFMYKLTNSISLVRIGAYLFVFLCLFLIWYLWYQINTIANNQRKLIYPEIVDADAPTGNHRWERILELSESLNENDWRLAIIEADIMLAELLEKMQLPGDTIGDKLKLIEKSDFTTLDNAWEGHKIRNVIAHQGTNYMLNQREAKRIITLYQSVFEEFHVI